MAAGRKVLIFQFSGGRSKLWISEATYRISGHRETPTLRLNIPSGVPPGPQTVTFCDPVVTITTHVLLIFVCVRHQLKINIM
jgi:hypothetical protein